MNRPVNNIRVLLVDDDAVGRLLLSESLSSAGLAADQVGSAEEMFQRLGQGRYDVVILDINLPGMDGIDATSRLRRHSNVGVILISVIHDDRTRILGMEGGADEYLVKPVNTRELIARIRQLASRVKFAASDRGPQALNVIKGITLDPSSQALRSDDGRTVALTPAEQSLLAYLVGHAHVICDREDLLMAMSSGEFPASGTRTVDTLVARLRRKLDAVGGSGACIRTVRGAGYIMTPPI